MQALQQKDIIGNKQMMLTYQFYEHEQHITPYMPGTYLGTKKVWNISSWWNISKTVYLEFGKQWNQWGRGHGISSLVIGLCGVFLGYAFEPVERNRCPCVFGLLLHKLWHQLPAVQRNYEPCQWNEPIRFGHGCWRTNTAMHTRCLGLAMLYMPNWVICFPKRSLEMWPITANYNVMQQPQEPNTHV